jgi:hypothetical protein
LFYRQGLEWISQHGVFKSQEQKQQEKQQTENLLSNIENALPNGTQLILEKVFRYYCPKNNKGKIYLILCY